MIPNTGSDEPETLLGHLNSNGTISGGIKIPGMASWLSDPSTGKSTVVQGLNATPASDRPTTAQVNAVHLAWDVMIGIGTLLFLLAAWYALSWLIRRDFPKSRIFLWIATFAGIASVLALEAGWVVTEVGRQPWIVSGQMRVQEAATTNQAVWATFLVVLAIYIGLGVTTILVLRKMSRRWREHEEPDESEVPYGPRPREVASDVEGDEVPVG
jgi:cytochrome d ubiquinol oxidase subunit I